MVQLAGLGDPARAVGQLRQGIEAFGCLLQHLEVDEPTQDYAARLRASLEDFDLPGFYADLPEADGPWRALRIFGQRRGQRYELRQAAPSRLCAVSPEGPLGSAVGDLALVARARPVSRDGRVNYLLRAEAGLGVGAVGWEAITRSLEEAAQLVASGDPRAPGAHRDKTERPSTETRVKILESHPQLRPEDIEVLGILWESFPNLAEVLLSVGRVEDLVVFDPKGDGGYQQLRLAARLRPDLLEPTYPELADLLAGVGRLALVQVVWVDDAGRQLARLSFDSEQLRVDFTCFVRAGRLLPVQDGVVRVDLPEPVGPRTCRALVDFRSQLNGLESRIHGMQVDWS